MEEGLPSRAIDSVTRLGRQPTKGNQYREQRGIETPLLTLLLSPDLPDTPPPPASTPRAREPTDIGGTGGNREGEYGSRGANKSHMAQNPCWSIRT